MSGRASRTFIYLYIGIYYNMKNIYYIGTLWENKPPPPVLSPDSLTTPLLTPFNTSIVYRRHIIL